jgi:hypothetical protein
MWSVQACIDVVGTITRACAEDDARLVGEDEKMKMATLNSSSLALTFLKGLRAETETKSRQAPHVTL